MLDAWSAYPECARIAKVRHSSVNHQEGFTNADGEHTNVVESIHGVVKREARCQFGRLPSVNGNGQPRYLDLVIQKADPNSL